MALRRLRANQPNLEGLEEAFMPMPETLGEELERSIVQIFALVGEAITGATHALLAGDRELAKALMRADEAIDQLADEVTARSQEVLVQGWGTTQEREELLLVLRMVPDLERNGDLAEHVARRAARGLGGELSPRSRGLLALVARFYERFGDHAVNLARRLAALITGGIEPHHLPGE